MPHIIPSVFGDITKDRVEAIQGLAKEHKTNRGMVRRANRKYFLSPLGQNPQLGAFGWSTSPPRSALALGISCDHSVNR
jgi:hypothetical protein